MPPAVASGSRHRAALCGPTWKNTAAIDGGDRAAAGCDAGDVETAQRDAPRRKAAIGRQGHACRRRSAKYPSRCRPCRRRRDRDARAWPHSAAAGHAARGSRQHGCGMRAARPPTAPCRHGERMMKSEPLKPASISRCLQPLRYAARSAAHRRSRPSSRRAHILDLRSTSLEREMLTSGSSRASRSAAAISCAGLR